MDCPCKVDHWRWLATGFAGIVTIMNGLTRAGVTASDEAMALLRTELAKLREEIDLQEKLRHGQVQGG